MTTFFQQFPKIEYDFKNDGSPGHQILTNIFFRVALLTSIKNNVFAYTPYFVGDSDRIDVVAEKIYGDSSLHWLIILANDFTDPLFDWPKDIYSFDKFIVSKYGSLSAAKTGIHHYEKHITRLNAPEQTQNIIKLHLTLDEYNALPEVAYVTYNLVGGKAIQVTTTRHAITNYDYEIQENDKKTRNQSN